MKIISLTTLFSHFILCFGRILIFLLFCQGDNLINIEPSDGTINDVCVFRQSGLMLMALDCSQIPAYFIPNLGPAPKWCSYLENLTVCWCCFFVVYKNNENKCSKLLLFNFLKEEMEEGSQTTIYDDYKFLTMEDLERLHLTNLIGTNLLRAYMHGFFIDYRLFKKVCIFCLTNLKIINAF